MEMIYVILAAFQLNNLSPWSKLLQAYRTFVSLFENNIAIWKLPQLSDHPLVLPIHRISIAQISIHLENIDRHQEYGDTDNEHEQREARNQPKDRDHHPCVMYEHGFRLEFIINSLDNYADPYRFVCHYPVVFDHQIN